MTLYTCTQLAELLGISLGSTAAAALVTFLVVRFITWRKKRRRTRTEQGQTRRGK